MTSGKVVLTRSENSIAELNQKYSHVEWIDFPLIQFKRQNLSSLDEKQILDTFEWLIFTSQNAVIHFFEQVSDIADWRNKEIACVGTKTARKVESYGLECSFTPRAFTSLDLASELPVSNATICHIGGNLSRKESLKILSDKSSAFKKIVIYNTAPHAQDRTSWQNLMDKETHVISFCSPSAVQSYVDQIHQYELELPVKITYAAIGSTTASAIQKYLGVESLIGEKHTFDSMITSINQFLSTSSS